MSYGATWRAPRPIDDRHAVPRLRRRFSPCDARDLESRGPTSRLVELGGRTAEVVGRVTMDQTMIATEGPVSIGDVATVYGGIVSLDQQARAAGTISYELLTALGSRLPRLYSSS